jgi:phage terminase large subunit-like protein
MTIAQSPSRDRTARKPLEPFTVDHFRKYASLLVLDNGDHWTLEPFQAEIASDIFAGNDEVWAILPEGSAKTTLMSGIGLYHGDYTLSAEVLLAAASRDQAGLLFSQAAGFITRTSGKFAQRFRVYEGYRRIKCLRLGGRLQVFAADDRTGDGVIPTLAFLDEGHRHRDLRLVRTWRGKLAKRGGQMVIISTAGEPGTEFEDARARAITTATTVDVDGFHTRAAGPYSVIHDWSVPEGEDVNDMDVVKQANPLAAITPESLRRKHDSPTMTDAHWRRFACNQAVRSDATAIAPHEWRALITDEQIPDGAPVWLGVDFGWKHDTTAIVPLSPEDRHRRLFGTPRILVPPRNGQSLSPQKVKDALDEFIERYDVQEVVMDPDRASEIAEWLEVERGIEPTVHGQGVDMFGAYDAFMAGVRNDWIRHPGDSEFTEHVLNAIARVMPDGRTRFDRPNPGRSNAEAQRRRVIDALIAAAMVNHACFGEDDEPEAFVAFLPR